MGDYEDIEELPVEPQFEDIDINPSFNDLFDDGSEPEEDKEVLDEIKVFKGPVIKQVFSERYYKVVLQGEDEIAKKLHSSLASFLKASDPQDKTMYRGRLEPVVWEMLGQVAQKVGNALPLEKKLFIRYALLLPSIISKDQKNNFSTVIIDNTHGEPVHYLDEWLEMVTLGEVAPLGSDETPVKATKSRGNSGLRVQKDKFAGVLDGRIASLRSFQKKRSLMEKSIVTQVKNLSLHTPHPALQSIEMPYSTSQKASLVELISATKNLQRIDREFSAAIHEAKNAKVKLNDVVQRMTSEPSEAVDPSIIKKEVNNLRQIHKMCVGRQGNHFPLLHGNYISSNFNDIATREQVLSVMREVEAIDPGAFRRAHRREVHRIVPHVIIMPCYGDKGICWEPFEKFNRATSRGRIAVPMYPKNIKLAVITAIADLRWEVAKAKAQYYWMEEGITGKYFQWFDENKMRGDVKLRFIEDYILWITKESVGTQKLDKEVRGIFWRNLPFNKELREYLKNRGYVYSELYKKDNNRELSSGY